MEPIVFLAFTLGIIGLIVIVWLLFEYWKDTYHDRRYWNLADKILAGVQQSIATENLSFYSNLTRKRIAEAEGKS